MAADDDDVIIDMDVTDEIRAVVTDQFRQQLPPDYEFDEASFIEFIMLLVANRRSKSQIRREMTPFVGDSAPALVDWLFAAMNALKPPPPPARPRLASVVLAPAPAPDPQHRKTPSTSSATRLLTNAAKDAARSASERRPVPGRDPSPTSPTARRAARWAPAAARPLELHTRRGIGADPKRSRSPHGVAVLDLETKRRKADDASDVRELQTRKALGGHSPPPVDRRPRLSVVSLNQALSRPLSGPGRRDSTTFTVSISAATEAVDAGPEVVFQAPGRTTTTGDDAQAMPKKPIRCSFWPQCDKGDRCTFVHPTQPCKYWPSCQFGDKCLYTHDKNLAQVTIPCKFGAKCTRGAECKFAHETTATNGAEGQVVKVCRYDTRCTKIACPFKHPARDSSEYFNDRLRDSHDDDDEDVTVVLSNTLPATPPF